MATGDSRKPGVRGRPVECLIANAARRLDPHVSAIRSAFATSVGHAARLLGAEGIDVVVVDAPDDAIPEWGVGGSTHGPHAIVIAIDPDRPAIDAAPLERTLLHEFHHAMRWRAQGLSGDLGEMLVSEGLAQLFESEVLGSPPPFAEGAIDEGDIARALERLHERPVDQSRWFFGARGVPRFFGYAYGYRLCLDYASSVAATASALTNVPTGEVLRRCGLPLS